MTIGPRREEREAQKEKERMEIIEDGRKSLGRCTQEE